jgi:hypothetical protein
LDINFYSIFTVKQHRKVRKIAFQLEIVFYRIGRRTKCKTLKQSYGHASMALAMNFGKAELGESYSCFSKIPSKRH